MAVLRSLAALWLGSGYASALIHTSSVEERVRAEFETMKAAYDPPLPELAGCKGFECLERFVKTKDNFKWQGSPEAPAHGEKNGVKWTGYSLTFQSQEWLQYWTGVHKWSHPMMVIVPENHVRNASNADVGVLFLERSIDPTAAIEMATRTGAVTLTVANMPFQPLTFHWMQKFSMDEDMARAWLWYMFSEQTEHPEWAIELPLAKAIVKAMDAATEYTANTEGLKRFIVTGHSQRATGAYLAAALDPRVEAIIPLGMPLDVFQTLQDSVQNLGGVTPKGLHFAEQEVMNFTDDQIKLVKSVVDPVSYMDRLKVPKLAMFSAGDDLLPPDCTRSWWGELPGQKMLYIAGNAAHEGFESNERTKYIEVADSFISAFLSGKQMPEIKWKIDDQSGDILIKQITNHTRISVSLVYTSSTMEGKRDFRSAEWYSSPLAPNGDGTWLAKAPEETKWTAFFVSFEFDGPRSGGPPYRLTTEVSVTPTVRPFPDAKASNPKFQVEVR